MKTFPLKAIFMFTLLFLLFANEFNWNLQAGRLKREAAEMSLELSQNQHEVAGFELRKSTYQRAAEAFEKHKTQYEAAIPKFQAVVDRYGELNVEDPSKLYLIDVPTLGIEEFLVKQIRVWTPNRQFQLGVGFRSLDDQSDFGDSRLFVPAEKKLVNLPAGESLIRFEWHELKEQRTLKGKVFLNDSLVHEFGLRGDAAGGYSSMSSVPTKSQAFRIRKERTLYKLMPSLESELAETIGLVLVHDRAQP